MQFDFFLGGGVFESVLISTKFCRKFDRESKTAITLSEHIDTCLFFFPYSLYRSHRSIILCTPKLTLLLSLPSRTNVSWDINYVLSCERGKERHKRT